MALVDQPQSERMAGELGTPDRDVSFGGLPEPADRIGVEVALDPRPRAKPRSIDARPRRGTLGDLLSPKSRAAARRASWKPRRRLETTTGNYGVISFWKLA
jgi:hypothetical protein